ncbi:hypothetical protein OIM90_22025 [Streptomyces sp. AD16]|nr:hypothetical protein OIM90_22025 [Streptomyces sp. AD16]
MLVVVDNVRQAPEIRALTPGDGLLVATSRTMLPALRMDGAVQLVVDPLDEREAIGIVRGWPVAQGEGPAAAELVRRCGGLPLALRAVGEWLVERPQLGLDDAVRSLAPWGGAAGGGWADEGAVDVMEQVFDSVLRQMPDHTRALYRFLGALPGTTFPAALPARPDSPGRRGARGPDDQPSRGRRRPRAARRGPGRSAAPVPDARPGPGARRHGGGRAARGGGAVPAPYGGRLLRRGGGARRPVDRRPLPPPGPACPLAGRTGLQRGAFSGEGQGLDWLDAERGNILAVLRAAAREGLHDAVWRICESLWPLFHERARHADSLEAHPLGIEAARWENRPDAEIRMRNQLARAHAALGDLDRAAEELRAAEPCWRRPRTPGCAACWRRPAAWWPSPRAVRPTPATGSPPRSPPTPSAGTSTASSCRATTWPTRYGPRATTPRPGACSPRRWDWPGRPGTWRCSPS